ASSAATAATQATAAATSAVLAGSQSFNNTGQIAALPTAGNTGTGANSVTITVNDGTNPIQNATVSMTQGSSVFSGVTNSSGQIAFSLGTATYTVAIAAAGYTFTPATLAVSGVTTHTYSMAQVVITPAGTPGQTNAYGYTYDGSGTIKAYTKVNFRLYDAAQSTNVYLRTSFSVTSGSDGLVQATMLQAAKYQFQVDGDSRWSDPFTTGTNATYPL